MKTFQQFLKESKFPSMDASTYYEEKLPTMMIDHGFYRDEVDNLTEGNINLDWSNKTGSVMDSVNHELLKKHMQSYSKDDQNALNNYIHAGTNAGHSSGSRDLNMHLIHLHENHLEGIDHYTTVGKHDMPDAVYDLKKLTAATRRNKLDKNLTTYSGLGYDPSQKSDHGIVHLPSYTSSTLNRGVAVRYSKPVDGIRHILHINHSPGHSGAYVGNHPDITKYYHDEFIMPRHSTVLLHSEPEEHENRNGDKFHIWTAERQS